MRKVVVQVQDAMVEISLNNERITESGEKVHKGEDSGVTGRWLIVYVNNGERAGLDIVMPQGYREDIGVNIGGKIRKNLKVVQEAYVDIYGHL